MTGLLLIFVRISGFTRVIHSFLSDCADIKKNPHSKENESSPDKYFDTEFITQYSTVMYNKRKYIKVLRSIPLSSISCYQTMTPLPAAIIQTHSHFQNRSS